MTGPNLPRRGEYKNGLEVYITEVDYGDTDQIAQPKQPQWSAQMDTIQKKEYYDFAKAAVQEE